jgi:hypothetical protein
MQSLTISAPSLLRNPSSCHVDIIEPYVQAGINFLRTYEYFGKYRSVNTAAILGRLQTHDGEVGLTQTRYDFRQKLTARFL